MKIDKKIFVDAGKKGADLRWKAITEDKIEIMSKLYIGRDRDLINWLTAGKSLEWLQRFLKYATKNEKTNST